MKYLLSVVFGVYFLSFVQMQGAYAQRVSEPTHAPLPTLIVLPDPTPDISLPIKPKVNVDYAGCAALRTKGKRGLGPCNANEVIVIVNDGRKGEMTCCPIGNNVFSTVAAEQNVRREGQCRADEVATGIKDLEKSIILCTKVNTQFLKTEYRATSIYAVSKSPGNLGALAKAYHNSDCCVCPEGSVFTGKHTAANDQCTDECVAIVKR